MYIVSVVENKRIEYGSVIVCLPFAAVFAQIYAIVVRVLDIIIFNGEYELQVAVKQSIPAPVLDDAVFSFVGRPNAIVFCFYDPSACPVNQSAGPLGICHCAVAVEEQVIYRHPVTVGIVVLERKYSLVLRIDESYLSVLHYCRHPFGEYPCPAILLLYDRFTCVHIQETALSLAAEYGKGIFILSLHDPLESFEGVSPGCLVVYANLIASVVAI